MDNQDTKPETDEVAGFTPEVSEQNSENQGQVIDIPSSSAPSDKTPHPGHHLSRKQAILAIVLVLILVIGSGAGAFLLGRRGATTSNQTEQPATDTKVTEQKNEAKTETEYAITAGDITFLSNPKPLGNLKLIESYVKDADYTPEGDPNESTQYYQIGSTKDGKEVIFMQFSIGLEGSGQYLVFANQDKYTVQTKAFGTGNFAFKWADNVALDEKTTIADLVAPDAAELSGQKIKKGTFFQSQSIITADTKLATNQKKEIGTVGKWKFYRAAATDEATYQIISMYATFGNIFTANYNPNGELAQAAGKEVAIKWTSGENNLSFYENGGTGCGTSGFLIPKNVQSSQLTQVGTSPQGQKLYQLPASHPFVKDLYDKDYAKGEYLTGDLKNLTIEQLTAKHGYFLVQNGFGDYVVMLRGDIFARGGCAKPVIYLYPTQTTKVSVGVGADVTLSEPLYPAGGWRNVIAQPNGSLTYQGKQYGSLFWEGYGWGLYPAITEGTVVPRSQALSTIERQLHEQGLNQQEIQDFLEFWKPKLTSKPYVRLTWFNTKQLDELAPLAINPRPQTSIRVFLDAQGLDTPVQLPAQHFSAPARHGFTVVEWGGLARDGSVPKLR